MSNHSLLYCSAHVVPLPLSLQSSQPDPLELQRQQESRRRAIARKRAREQFRPHSPEAVEGRKHMEVQTELYLEEITDRVEEAEVQTQTDAFLDRPPTPLFVPAKTGVDVATQIEEGEVSMAVRVKVVSVPDPRTREGLVLRLGLKLNLCRTSDCLCIRRLK